MTNHREFAVPKEKLQVTVSLTTGEALAGSIFLEHFPEAQSLHQKVTAFLEDKNDFFPLAADGGSPRFINKGSLRMMEVDFADEEPSYSLMRIVDITAVFTDGATVNGSLMADVPAEKARLSDCLNLPSRFLSVRTAGKILFLNKDAVRAVEYAPGN